MDMGYLPCAAHGEKRLIDRSKNRKGGCRLLRERESNSRSTRPSHGGERLHANARHLLIALKSDLSFFA